MVSKFLFLTKKLIILNIKEFNTNLLCSKWQQSINNREVPAKVQSINKLINIRKRIFIFFDIIFYVNRIALNMTTRC